MTGFEKARELSLLSFLEDTQEWATESQDHVSLSKYSIWKLLDLACDQKIAGDGLTLWLRAAALKREHLGASSFLLWSFASTPPLIEQYPQYLYNPPYGLNNEDKENLYGIGVPEGELFKMWFSNKTRANSLEEPKWSLPSLADFADEFLQLSNQLTLLGYEFDSKFQSENFSMDKGLNEIFFFDEWQSLSSLAMKVLKRAAAEYRENPLDSLLEAFEGIGLISRRIQRSKDMAIDKDSTFKNLTKGQD